MLLWDLYSNVILFSTLFFSFTLISWKNPPIQIFNSKFYFSAVHILLFFSHILCSSQIVLFIFFRMYFHLNLCRLFCISIKLYLSFFVFCQAGFKFTLYPCLISNPQQSCHCLLNARIISMCTTLRLNSWVVYCFNISFDSICCSTVLFPF